LLQAMPHLIDSQVRSCFKARLEPLDKTSQRVSRSATSRASPDSLYNSVLNAHRTRHPSGPCSGNACDSACPRNVSSGFRPVHILAHPIGGRYNIPRFVEHDIPQSVEQGRKGDRSKFWRAWGFGDIVASVFTPVAAEAPTRQSKRTLDIIQHTEHPLRCNNSALWILSWL
jgi:hypothetical protein